MHCISQILSHLIALVCFCIGTPTFLLCLGMKIGW
jgi:hypothetical protein